jgi:hypothetical protein
MMHDPGGNQLFVFGGLYNHGIDLDDPDDLGSGQNPAGSFPPESICCA